jgi:hypothetical protein
MMSRRRFFRLLAAGCALVGLKVKPVEACVINGPAIYRPHAKQREFFESAEHGISMRFERGKWFRGPRARRPMEAHIERAAKIANG